jgi:hypothetical protein
VTASTRDRAGAGFLAFRLREADPLGEAMLRALTAAVEDEDPELADPHLEKRIEAAGNLARWEERMRVAAAKGLKQWTQLVQAAVLGDSLTAAPEGGEGSPPDPNAIPGLSAQWTEILAGTVEVELTAMLGEVFAGILGEAGTVSARPWQEQFIGQVRNRLVGVADQTFDMVRDVVAAGINEGSSIPDMRRLVQQALDVRGESSWAGRAETIARTETIAAYNGGHLHAWQLQDAEAGIAREKVWLATIDRRTRRSHYRADGQRVALDGKFAVGRAQLDHPGDPRAPAEEVVSCRCTMLVVDPDEETPDTAERQMRSEGEISDEIDRRAEEDGDVRAFDDPAAPSGPRAPARQESPPPTDEPLVGEDAYASIPDDVWATASDAEVNATGRYIGFGYRDINGELRSGALTDETRDKYVAPLDALIARSRAPKPLLVHRGIKDASFLGDDVVGVEIRDLSYMSTTTDQAVAHRFIDNEPNGALLNIRLPAGHAALKPGEAGRTLTESELLLPREMRLRIVDEDLIINPGHEGDYEAIHAAAEQGGWDAEQLQNTLVKFRAVLRTLTLEPI